MNQAPEASLAALRHRRAISRVGWAKAWHLVYVPALCDGDGGAPYVRRNKNDAVDAAAICEAAGRPGQRFVPMRSTENQAELMRHRARELLAGQRTAALNCGGIWPRSASSRHRAHSMPMT